MTTSVTLMPNMAPPDAFIGYLADPSVDSRDFTPRLIWTGVTNPYDKLDTLRREGLIDIGIYIAGLIMSTTATGSYFPTFNVYTLEEQNGTLVLCNGIHLPQMQTLSTRIVNWPPR